MSGLREYDLSVDEKLNALIAAWLLGDGHEIVDLLDVAMLRVLLGSQYTTVQIQQGRR